jgi:hypothetical protein
MQALLNQQCPLGSHPVVDSTTDDNSQGCVGSLAGTCCVANGVQGNTLRSAAQVAGQHGSS